MAVSETKQDSSLESRELVLLFKFYVHVFLSFFVLGCQESFMRIYLQQKGTSKNMPLEKD